MMNGLGSGRGPRLTGRLCRWTAGLALGIGATLAAADLTYTVNSAAPTTVTITGYTGSGGVVTVPATIGGKTVTAIGDRAFYYGASLTRITLPGTLTSIGERAFYYCSGLTSLTVPNSVTRIEGRAFYHCSGLTSAMIGSGVTSIGSYAFAGCHRLADAYFQGNAPSVGGAAFEGDDGVTVYRGPAATGWGASFGGRPTALWPLPTITAVGPTRAPSAGGSRVVITGTRLTAATAVRFGTVPATAFTVGSDDQIVATVPPGTAGETVDIQVSTPGGTAADTSADDFTYNAFVVTDVTSTTPNGTYGPGAVIGIRVTFSEKVTVTGSPQLTLETGTNDALADYTGGSGSVALTFTYTVQAGQVSADLDCARTAALALHGGSILNATANPAVLTLPTPGRAHPLGANQALVVAAVGAPNGPFLARQQAAQVLAGRGLWDLTGAYALSVGGQALTLNLVHDPRGRLTGTAALQVNTGSALLPVSLSVRGTARGAGGRVVVALWLQGADAAQGLDVALAAALTLDVGTRQLHGPLTGTILVNGAGTPLAETVTLALPAPMDGTWSLSCALLPTAKGGRGGVATLTLANGVSHTFAIRGRLTGSVAALELSGLPTDPSAAPIRIRATIETLGGALTGLSAVSAWAYGQSLVWP